MKPTDKQRADLLDQLFPAASSASVEGDDVLRWVSHERAAHRRTRQRCAYLGVAALTLLVASALFTTPWRRRSTFRDNSPIAQAQQSASPGASEEIRSSPIERVDDNQLLGLMDDTPAALVEWPDGRRSLLVLVKNTAAD